MRSYSFLLTFIFVVQHVTASSLFRTYVVEPGSNIQTWFRDHVAEVSENPNADMKVKSVAVKKQQTDKISENKESAVGPHSPKANQIGWFHRSNKEVPKKNQPGWFHRLKNKMGIGEDSPLIE